MDDSDKMDRFKGCLIGGAVGDALGAPVEFMSLNQIKSEFGEKGIKDYAPVYGRTGAITDDTQMLLFTAEGLILSRVRMEYAEKGLAIPAVYHALLRWLYTQDTHRQGQLIKSFGSCSIVDGILTGFKELFSQRSPGNTCLSALRSGKMGTIEHPVNNSKGCGGIMRMAPVGLMDGNPEKAFQTGAECAAITHGHPTGYLASGFLAALISGIISEKMLTDAIDDSTRILKTFSGHEECLRAIEKAMELHQASFPEAEAVQQLGEGWVAEETLSISLYCALAAGCDYKKGVLLAVNHSGDSDSTGAVTGNIIGAGYGKGVIPEKWIDELELKNVIEEIAEDLFNHSAKP